MFREVADIPLLANVSDRGAGAFSPNAANQRLILRVPLLSESLVDVEGKQGL